MTDVFEQILNNPQQLEAISLQAFNDADTDKSGQIDAKELAALMKQLTAELGVHPEPVTDSEVLEILMALDKDHNGKLDVKEFQAFTKMTLQAMQASFKANSA